MESPNHLALNRWRHHQRVSFIGVDPAWKSWLLDSGSLTTRLQNATQGDFYIRILNQGWQLPQLSEAKRLGIKHGQHALIREVALMCHNEPWVFARSVFPLQTLNGNLKYLKKLDNRSLGSLLFKDSSTKRTLFEIAALESRKITALPISESNEVLWGRRSLFFITDKPILVAEIFLPAIKDHAKKLRL